MNVGQLFQEMFYRGDIFITHYVTCETGQHIYVVETSEAQMMFEITQDCFEKINASHPTTIVQALECGCVAHIIQPSGIDTQSQFSSN